MSELGAVVAKMVCNTMETHEYSHNYSQRKVRLGAVCGNSGENAAFTKATPSGECWMQIDASAPAAAFFIPGKKYYVTFTEAPD